MTKTILFVHGFMNTGNVWKEWRQFFEQKGYTCYAPSWPYMEGVVKDLKENSQTARGSVSFKDVVEHYQTIIQTLPEKPILIGHSLGGILVQKLLEKELGVGAICITSGPPKGIFAWDKDFLLSNLQLTNPFSRDDLVLMPASWYHKYVTNNLTLEETEIFIQEECVPASRKIPATIESINFKKAHAPLLFIAGGADKSQPPIITRKNAQAYTDQGSRLDIKIFEDRTHAILNQENWQEVAAYCLKWIQEVVL